MFRAQDRTKCALDTSPRRWDLTVFGATWCVGLGEDLEDGVICFFLT